MSNYCLKCRRHKGNVSSKKVIIKNKAITEKSKCAICLSKMPEFLKQMDDKKRGWSL